MTHSLLIKYHGRFYVLNRSRCGTDECPEEVVELTGSTGNIYCVRIARQPECDCPHAKAGHQCKHWLYVSEHPRPKACVLLYSLLMILPR